MTNTATAAFDAETRTMLYDDVRDAEKRPNRWYHYSAVIDANGRHLSITAEIADGLFVARGYVGGHIYLVEVQSPRRGYRSSVAPVMVPAKITPARDTGDAAGTLHFPQPDSFPGRVNGDMMRAADRKRFGWK